MEPSAIVVGVGLAGLVAAAAATNRVDELMIKGGRVSGVTGSLVETSDVKGGEASSRNVVSNFRCEAKAVIITSGGIGTNHELIRKNWPSRLGQTRHPKFFRFVFDVV